MKFTKKQMAAAKNVVKALNQAFRSDPAATHLAMCASVPCNKALGDHPTIIVNLVTGLARQSIANWENGPWCVNTVGWINGVLSVLGLPNIEARWEKVSESEVDPGWMKFSGFKIAPSCLPAKKRRKIRRSAK